MRLIVYIVLIKLCCIPLFAQDDLLNTRQYLLSFNKTKLSLGIGGDIGGNSVFLYKGTKPMKSEIVGPFYFSGILFFDFHSPKSIIGLALAPNFDWLMFTYVGTHSASFSYNNIDVQYIKIPLYLKMKFGKKFSATNLVFFGGGSFDIPIMYKDSNTLTLQINHNDNAILQSGFSTTAGIALQLNFRGKMRDQMAFSVQETGTNEKVFDILFPRIWIYAKASQMLYNLYNVDYGVPIFTDYTNEELDFRDIRFSLGFMYFLGGKRQNRVQ